MSRVKNYWLAMADDGMVDDGYCSSDGSIKVSSWLWKLWNDCSGHQPFIMCHSEVLDKPP